MAHLVFQTAFPGDLFLSIPLLKRLKDWDPRTAVALACRPGLGDFFLKSGLVDEVISIDKKSAAGRREGMGRVQGEEWDLVLVPHESVRTGFWMARVRARRAKVGFAQWWNRGLFNHRVTKPVHLPDALRQLSLLTPLDGSLAERFGSEELQALASPVVRTSPLSLSLPKIPEWASMTVKENVPSGRKIFLAPGSVWNTKKWTAGGYTDLARLLLERGYSVELVGSPAEKELCDSIAAKVPGVENRAGKTSLGELVELFSGGLALVCNDSGAMHAAAAADLPTVAVFGPTVLEQGFRPWQNRAIVVQKDLKCRPCGKHGAKKCPIGTHECMVSISAAEVLSALESLVGETYIP